jgi:phosphodiesterase/alkaline phosphatase D-like protein
MLREQPEEPRHGRPRPPGRPRPLPLGGHLDDHEVQNDYANTQSQYEGDIGALRAAAHQAWYEHQPVRAPATPDADGPRVYRRLHWGRLAQLDVIDGRQFRSVPPCDWGEAPACPDAYDPSVTMLGQRQERWLDRGFAASRARWNILGNNVMVARLDHDGPAGQLLWHDAWDGFPAARNRLTRAWVEHQVSNPVVVTGDCTPPSSTTSTATSTTRRRRWWRRSLSAPPSPATATPRSTAPTTTP